MRIDAILFGEVVNTITTTTITNTNTNTNAIIPIEDDEQMQITPAETTEIVIPFNSFLRGGIRSGDETKQIDILGSLSRQLVSAIKESVDSINLSEVKIIYDGPRNLFTISVETSATSELPETFATDSEISEVNFAQQETILQRVRELEGTEYSLDYLDCSDDTINSRLSTHKFIFRLVEVQCS